MDKNLANKIVNAYVDAINSKSWDKFEKFCTPDVMLQSFQRGIFQWERNGIASLNDHAKKVMIPIAPDFRISEIMIDFVRTFVDY